MGDNCVSVADNEVKLNVELTSNKGDIAKATFLNTRTIKLFVYFRIGDLLVVLILYFNDCMSIEKYKLIPV